MVNCSQSTLHYFLLLLFILNIFSATLADIYDGFDENIYSGDYGTDGGSTSTDEGSANFQCEEFHQCEQQCIKLDHEICFCNRGFKINSDKQTCSDINECDYENGDCQHLCTNLLGSYYCTCSLGYSRGSDGLACHDIDECEEELHNCKHECLNHVGGFSCLCDEGYYLADNSTDCHKIIFKLSPTDELTLLLAGTLTGVGILVMLTIVIIFGTALVCLRRIGINHPYSVNNFI